MTRIAAPAAAVVAAACALAACGPVRMGAAAIVGNQRISTATLAAQVSDLETAYRNSHGTILLRFPQSQAPEQVLGWLLRFRVTQALAARYHIQVTPAAGQRALSSLIAQARASGYSVGLADLAVANGLPPDLIGELGRYQAIDNAVIRRLDGGTLPRSPTGLAALSQKFRYQQCLAAKSLRIQVNPQFGSLDYRQLAVVPAASTLSAPQVPSPAPRATASC
jgi:hypothetical protein